MYSFFSNGEGFQSEINFLNLYIFQYLVLLGEQIAITSLLGT